MLGIFVLFEYQNEKEFTLYGDKFEFPPRGQLQRDNWEWHRIFGKLDDRLN